VSKSQNHLFSLPGRDLDHILSQAAADLEALRGRKLFVTGGTGFFGKWLLAGLQHANAELGLGLRVTVLSRDPAAFLRRHPEVADITSLNFIAGHLDNSDLSLPAQPLDYILHAGTDTSAVTTETEERKRSQAILWGTRHMIDLLHRSGAKRLLNVSSGAVYGAAAGERGGASENCIRPGSSPAMIPYGEAKLEAERLCEGAGLDFVTARCFAFLGPYLPLDAHFAAGNFLRDALRGGPILVRGDGTALRSYLHPADLVVWLLRILVRGQRARAYNVGSDEAVTTAQLAHLIAGAVQPAAEVVIQSAQPQGPQNIYLPNIARARSELNLDVAIPLAGAVTRTLAFLRSGKRTTA